MTNFTFDGAHSSLEFQIKHLMVSKVKGSFDQFDVAVEGDINDFINFPKLLQQLFQAQLTLKTKHVITT